MRRVGGFMESFKRVFGVCWVVHGMCWRIHVCIVF